MLSIKLMPTGRKNERHYRIVVAPARSKLTGAPVAFLGTPDHYDTAALADWLKKGAQPTAKIRSLCQIS